MVPSWRRREKENSSPMGKKQQRHAQLGYLLDSLGIEQNRTDDGTRHQVADDRALF